MLLQYYGCYATNAGEKSVANIVRTIAVRQALLQVSKETGPWRMTFLMWKFETAECAADLSHTQNLYELKMEVLCGLTPLVNQSHSLHLNCKTTDAFLRG